MARSIARGPALMLARPRAREGSSSTRRPRTQPPQQGGRYANPNPSPQSDPEVLTRFQEELARAAALPGLAAAGPALWPRFAGYYQGLTRLPRRLRRALQRRWRRSLGGLALLCALGQAPALAATIAVDGTACTLIDAITAANSDAPAGGCTAGSGADTLVLPAGSTHTLTAVNTLMAPERPAPGHLRDHHRGQWEHHRPGP